MTPISSSQLSDYIKIGNPLDEMHLTQGFGECHPSVCKNYKSWGLEGHNGHDLRAPTGTPVMAVFDGRVTSCGVDHTGGIFITMQTPPVKVDDQSIALEVIYYHLQTYNVRKGQKYDRGEQIGRADNTGGVSTGSHLHFGCKINYELIPRNGDIPPQYIKDYENGYRGAVDPVPLYEDQCWLPNKPDDILYYEGRIIKADNSPRVFKVLGLTRHHIPNEKMAWKWGISLDKDVEVYSPIKIALIPEAEPLIDPNHVSMTTEKMNQVLKESIRYGGGGRKLSV